MPTYRKKVWKRKISTSKVLEFSEELLVAVDLWYSLLLHRAQAGAVTLGTTASAVTREEPKLYCSLHQTVSMIETLYYL